MTENSLKNSRDEMQRELHWVKNIDGIELTC